MSDKKSNAEANTTEAPESIKPAEKPVLQTEKQIQKQVFSERRVRIKIPSGRSIVERSPVSVGVNGVAFQIKRDTEVDVPVSVVEVLENAKEQVPTYVEENGHKRVIFKDALRFPYQILGYVNPKTGKLEAV